MNAFPFSFPSQSLSEIDSSRLQWYYKRFVEAYYKEYRFGHFLMAAYAAVPAMLNPDLLYKIWQNFNAYKWNGEPVNIHRIAVADLLLSPLCREVGYELYEMHHDIRMSLLQWLKEEAASELWQSRGIKDINEIAKFVEDYHRMPNDADLRWGIKYSEAQTLEAISYYDPHKASEMMMSKMNAATFNYKETELLYTLDMFLKIREKLSKLNYDDSILTGHLDKQADWMQAWKSLIENNESGFIQKLNEKPELLELLKDTNDGGIEVLISADTVEKIRVINERKLKLLVIAVDEYDSTTKAHKPLNDAQIFTDTIKKHTSSNILELQFISGQEATSLNIRRHLTELINTSAATDDLVVYISSESVEINGHCNIRCYDSYTDDAESLLSDNKMNEIFMDFKSASLTLILEVNDAARGSWFDNKQNNIVVFASSGTKGSIPMIKIDSNAYSAFTYALCEAINAVSMNASNRDLFVDALGRYDDLLSSDTTITESIQTTTPELICNQNTYNQLFLQSKNLTAKLQNLLRDTGWYDKRTTGEWNKHTAKSLEQYINATSFAKDLSKQEYINRLTENLVYNNDKGKPVFLLIFSDPGNGLKEIKRERAGIERALKTISDQIELVILDDPSISDLVSTLSKPELRNKIELIHYSGMDDKGNFVLKDGSFDYFDMAFLLQFQSNLNLLISNTCRSGFFAKYLTILGVKAAVGGDAIIMDDDAAIFGEAIINAVVSGQDIAVALDELRNQQTR